MAKRRLLKSVNPLIESEADNSSPTTIAIIGTGYVGMACVVGFAEFGYNVVGYDIIPERVRQLQNGITPYREAGISESLVRHLRTGRATFVDDFEQAVRGAQFIVVAVGTPSRPDGSADMTSIETVVERLAELHLDDSTVVVRSTVPPGTSERIAERLGNSVTVLYAPEFLREGSAVPDFLAPDRIVIGAPSTQSAQAYKSLFAHLGCPVLVMSLRDAELAKGMSNAFLAMKISFANQVANLCDELDADALEVLSAVGHDRRIGQMFLHPGIGFGGPCFEKDLKSMIHLSKENNADFDLLNATLGINDRQPGRIVEVLESELERSVSGLVVGVWGLSFKGGTDDLRDSLAVRVVEDLTARGAIVRAYDPSFHQKTDHPLKYTVASSALDAADADALVVLTDWPQFRTVDPRAVAHRLRSGLIVDGRNVLDAAAVSSAGMRYRGIGRRKNGAQIQLAEAG